MKLRKAALALVPPLQGVSNILDIKLQIRIKF
jgi:hypothetical protein